MHNLFSERRFYQRLAIPANAYLFFPQKNRWFQGRLKDISAEGAGLELRHNLMADFEMDSSLELWIALPGKDYFFSICADIVWLQRKDEEGFNLGVRFSQIILMEISQLIRAAKSLRKTEGSEQ